MICKVLAKWAGYESEISKLLTKTNITKNVIGLIAQFTTFYRSIRYHYTVVLRVGLMGYLNFFIVIFVYRK